MNDRVNIGPGGTVDLNNWFTYHAPQPEQIAMYQHIREMGMELALLISAHCPPSTERSTALTKVREAVMWANAAIACNTKDASVLVNAEDQPRADVSVPMPPIGAATEARAKIIQQFNADTGQVRTPLPIVQDDQQVGWGIVYDDKVWTECFSPLPAVWDMRIEDDRLTVTESDPHAHPHPVTTGTIPGTEVPDHDWMMPHEFPHQGNGMQMNCPPNCPYGVYMKENGQ